MTPSRHDERRVVDEAGVRHVVDAIEDLDLAVEPLQKGDESDVLLLQEFEIDRLRPVGSGIVAAARRRADGYAMQRRHHGSHAEGLSR